MLPLRSRASKLRKWRGNDEVEQDAAGKASPALRQMFGNSTLWLLFATGLTSMGMEVVWTRQYAIYIGTPRLFIRNDPGRLPGRDVYWLQRVPLLEPPAPERGISDLAIRLARCLNSSAHRRLPSDISSVVAARALWVSRRSAVFWDS